MTGKVPSLNDAQCGNTVGYSRLIIGTKLIHGHRSGSSGVDLVVCSSCKQSGSSYIVKSGHIS